MSGTPVSTLSQRGVLVRFLLFALVLIVWSVILRTDFSPVVSGLLIVGPVLGAFPLIRAGRRRLDKIPIPEQAVRITTVVHYTVLPLLGTALVEAIKTAPEWRGWTIPIDPAIGLTLAWITGILALMSVANLALRGWGAPFAIALSQRLATDWMYHWTRNPMVFSTLAFFVSVGLYVQSALFLAWLLLLAIPSLLTFVKVFEERELEIRFGKPYLEYRAKTSFLIPWKPKA